MIIREKMRGVHPRLEYSKESIELAKKAIEKSESLQAEVRDAYARAEELIKEELLEYSPQMNMAAACGQFGNMTGTFVCLYMLGEKKYIEYAKRAALHFAEYPMWTNAGMLDKLYAWHSELNTTMLLNTMSNIYDTMYDEFTEDERKILRNAMLKNGIDPLLDDWVHPETRIHALDSMGHNWWGVCVGGALMGMCAIYDEIDPIYMTHIQTAIKSLKAYCEYKGEQLLAKPATFDENGMLYEGALYLNYGIGEMCCSLLAYKNCFEDEGESDFELLKKIPDTFLAHAYPTSGENPYLFVDFGDSNPWIGGHSPMAKSMLKIDSSNENFKRFFNRAYGKPHLWDDAHPGIFECDGARPVIPKTLVAEEGGLCMIRSSDEDDATFLAVRCGHSWNHAHADAGSFEIFHGGEQIFCDSGSTTYGRREYGNYYTQSKAHSVMLINGEGMFGWNVSRGSRIPGKIRHFVEDGKLCYFIADATGPYSNQCYRNQRSFFRLDDQLYVVMDDITCYNESDYQFLLHYNGNMTEDGDRMLFDTGRNRAVVTTYVDRGFTRVINEFESHKWVSLNVNGKDRRCAMMNVITLGDEECEITPINGYRWYGVEIKYRGNKYRVYYNHESDGQKVHENSINNLGEWVTDAYALCDVNDGERVIMALGSFLRKDGKSRFEDWTKQTKIL